MTDGLTIDWSRFPADVLSVTVSQNDGMSVRHDRPLPIHLTLTDAQARALATVCRRVYGNPQLTARTHLDAVRGMLAAHGYDAEYHRATGLLTFAP